MTDVVRVLPPTDDELLEQWTRTGPDPELTGVEVLLLPDHPWQIVVSMAELVRTGPLLPRLEQAVFSAIQAVPGVTQVAREDTEVWLAWGTPTGEALAHAVATVVDTLSPEVPRPTLDNPSPMDRKPLIASGILAVVGIALLFDGLRSSNNGTIVLGVVTLLFFGGGGLTLLLLERRRRR